MFDVLQSRETSSSFTDKHDVLLKSGAFFENGIGKSSFSTGLIRVSHMVIPHVLKHHRTHVFDDFGNLSVYLLLRSKKYF